MTITSLKIALLLEDLAQLNPLGIRLVGSQGLAATLVGPADSPASDVDIHVIVENLIEATRCSSFLSIPADIDVGQFDVVATKFRHMDVVCSVHLYTPGLFREICGFASRAITIFRTTIGRTRFDGYGARRSIPFFLPIHALGVHGYVAEYRHHPLKAGKLYMLPYQTMALSGTTLADSCGLELERSRLIERVVGRLVDCERVEDLDGFDRLFGRHIGTVDNAELGAYRRLFLQGVDGARLIPVREVG